MRKILAALLILLPLPVMAAAPTDTVYMSGLTAAGAVADTDTMAVCQNAGGCGSGVNLLRVTPAQLTTYFRTKFSGTSPISYNSGTGAFSLPLVSAHLFVGSAGGVATDVALTGDASITNAGAMSVLSIGGKAVTLGGSFTTSGASPLIFTLTGSTNLTLPTSGTLMNNALTAAHIHVGSAGGVATDVAVSGDISITSAGAVTLANSGVVAGNCTSCDLSIDAKGRVTAKANGTGGTGAGLPSITSGHIIGNATGAPVTAGDVTFAAGAGLRIDTAPGAGAGVMTLNSEQAISPKSSAGTSIDATDGNKFVKLGGFTYTIGAATGGLGSGWASVLQNIGPGTATVNVSGSFFVGLVSGTSLSTLQLAVGDQAVLVSDGTNYTTAISHSNTFLDAVTFGGTVTPALVTLTASGNIDGTHCGKTINFNAATNQTLTVQNTLPVNCNVAIDTLGAGLATITAQAGATQATACTTARSRVTNSVMWIHGRTNASGTNATYSVSGDCVP